MNRTASFIVGLAAGTAIGMLAAPATGRETRKKIMEDADRMLDEALTYKRRIASRIGGKKRTAVPE